jgi:hypothetical protein
LIILIDIEFGKLLLRTLENIKYTPGLYGWAVGIKDWYVEALLGIKFRNKT